MKTVYDFATMALFAGIIVLFLQRSTDGYEGHDPMWRYLLAGAGCAAANYFGNDGMHLVAIAILLGTVAFIFHVLKPFRKS